MTTKNSGATEPAGDDQSAYDFQYDHGRMPFFMKVVWVGFLVMATLYVVNYLLVALSEELGG